MIGPDDPRTSTEKARSGRTAKGLLGDVLRHASGLIQSQVELAKAEASETASKLKTAIGEIVAGAVLLIVSLGILLSALVSGLARVLMALFGEGHDAGSGEVVGMGDVDGPVAQIAAAVNSNVDAALNASRALPAYESLAALIVGVVFAVIGGLLLKNGMGKLDGGSLAPSRTIRQVRKDSEIVRDRT